MGHYYVIALRIKSKYNRYLSFCEMKQQRQLYNLKFKHFEFQYMVTFGKVTCGRGLIEMLETSTKLHQRRVYGGHDHSIGHLQSCPTVIVS